MRSISAASQPLMLDQPQPACDKVENNSAEHHGQRSGVWGLGTGPLTRPAMMPQHRPAILLTRIFVCLFLLTDQRRLYVQRHLIAPGETQQLPQFSDKTALRHTPMQTPANVGTGLGGVADEDLSGTFPPRFVLAAGLAGRTCGAV
jgi:hypothetical protein